jgi:hypothetical protein
LAVTAASADLIVPNIIITAPAQLNADAAVTNFVVPTHAATSAIITGPVVANFTVPSPTLSYPANLSVVGCAADFVVPASFISAPATVLPAPVESDFVVPSPAVSYPASLSVDSVTANFVVPSCVLSAPATLNVQSISSVFTVPIPTTTIIEDIFNVVSVTANFVVPSAFIYQDFYVGAVGDKIYDFIQTYGKTVTIYNKTRSYNTSAKVTPPYPVTDGMVKEGIAKRGDALVYVPAKNLRILLAAGGWVKIDGQMWIIHGVNTIWTFKDPGLFGLHLGKSGTSRRVPSSAQTSLDKKFEKKLPSLFSKVGTYANFPDENERLLCIPVSETDDYIAPGEIRNHGALKLYLNGFTLPFTPIEGDKVELEGIDYRVEIEEPVYTGDQIGIFGIKVVR